MSPLADLVHQEIQSTLAAVFRVAVGFDSPIIVNAGANVSDREAGWEHNYRVPDVGTAQPLDPQPQADKNAVRRTALDQPRPAPVRRHPTRCDME